MRNHRAGADCRRSPSGGLKVSRKASTYLVSAESYTDTLRSRAKLYAYALATAEENASAAPSSRLRPADRAPVMPAVLYHLVNTRFSRLRILRALATGGLFGNVAKTNSSISGAEVGCQGEVGVACAMAAAAACQLFGGTPLRSSMRRKWASNTTWDLRATRFADWCRSLHRAQRRRRSPCARRQQLCQPLGRPP